MANKLNLKSEQAYTYKEKKGNGLPLTDILAFGKILGIDLLSDDGKEDTKNNLVENTKNILEDPGAGYNTPIDGQLQLLIQGNADLAKATKDIAASALELTYMAKANYDVGQQIAQGVEARLSALLVLLGEVGTGKRWHSQEEALAEIHNRMHGTVRSAKGVGIQTD